MIETGGTTSPSDGEGNDDDNDAKRKKKKKKKKEKKLPKSSDEKEKKKKEKKLRKSLDVKKMKKKSSEATSSTSGPGNIAQQLLPSATLDKPLLKLAEIFCLGHTNNDAFAIKCAQEYIHSVDDFIALRYEELLDIFEL